MTIQAENTYHSHFGKCLYFRLIRMVIQCRRNVMNRISRKVMQSIQVCFVLKACVVCGEGQMMLGFYSRL